MAERNAQKESLQYLLFDNKMDWNSIQLYMEYIQLYVEYIILKFATIIIVEGREGGSKIRYVIKISIY